jgi:hypothetical protein
VRHAVSLDANVKATSRHRVVEQLGRNEHSGRVVGFAPTSIVPEPRRRRMATQASPAADQLRLDRRPHQADRLRQLGRQRRVRVDPASGADRACRCPAAHAAAVPERESRPARFRARQCRRLVDEQLAHGVHAETLRGRARSARSSPSGESTVRRAAGAGMSVTMDRQTTAWPHGWSTRSSAGAMPGWWKLAQVVHPRDALQQPELPRRGPFDHEY